MAEKGNHKKMIRSLLINKHYIHRSAIDVEKIPYFGQKPHYNLISVISHVLILMGIHPVNITNMDVHLPVKRSIVVRRSPTKGKNYSLNEREQLVESVISEIVEPLQRGKIVTEKIPRRTYLYYLKDMKTGRHSHLYWTHYIEGYKTNPQQKIKIAWKLSKMLGIKRVACIDGSPDINNKESYIRKYAPFRFMACNYPSPASRKLIYVNLIRLLEGGNNDNPTLSDKIIFH